MTDYIDVTNLMAQPIKSMGAITELCLELQKEIDRLQDIAEEQRDALWGLIEIANFYVEYIDDQEDAIIASDRIKIATKALSLTATERDVE